MIDSRISFGRWLRTRCLDENKYGIRWLEEEKCWKSLSGPCSRL